jgi:DNA-binding transcriptional regulator WhiA
MRTENQYQKAINYYNKGLNKTEISKIIDIPRTTISDWIKKKPNFEKVIINFNPKDYVTSNNLKNTYSYILGLYLGDGYINQMKNKRTYRLRIFNDVKYDNLNKYIISELQKLFFNNKVGFVDSKTWLSIYVYSNKLPLLFPQHGSGKKHNRKIELFDWQKDIISYKYLLMGLFHSDGCYYFNNIKGKKYESYSFSNKSKDIYEIFQNCCKSLNIEYTKSPKTPNTEIRQRNSVEYLKNNIGTKESIVFI